MGVQVPVLRPVWPGQHRSRATNARSLCPSTGRSPKAKNNATSSAGPDYATVQWMEEQGYDVTYTDDVQTDAAPASLLTHKVDRYLRPQRVLVERLLQQHAGRARTRGEHRLASAPTRPTGRRATRTTTARSSATRRSRAAGGIGGATPNDPASIGPNGERFPALATTTRRDFGTPAGYAQLSTGRTRRCESARERAVRRDVRGRQRGPRLGPDSARRQRRRRIRGLAPVAQQRRPHELGDDPRQRTRGLGVGPGPKRHEPGI